VIDAEGGQLGIMNPTDALALARDMGLDLVEVAPQSAPPVCRILDYGKYLYQQNKKQHDAKKKQKFIHVKEVKFRPKTEEHDYQFKKKHIERFIKEGDKVKATIMFRGREMAHPNYGRRILERLKEELAEQVVVEQQPRMEGRFMSMIIAAKKQ
jgi:translation initiation factor IF-3